MGVGDRDHDYGLVDRAGLSGGGDTSDCGMLDCVLSIPQSSVPSSALASFHWHLASTTSPAVL